MIFQGELAPAARLLSRLWMKELDARTLAAFRSARLDAAFRRVGGISPSADLATLDELAADYCQLLVGPSGHLPPFQSVWEEGQLHGCAVDATRSFLELLPADCVDLPRGLACDHFAIQLEIASWLLEFTHHVGTGEDAVLETVDSGEKQATWRDVAETFVQRHLAWSFPLLEGVRKKARTRFYRQLAVVTQDFVLCLLSGET